MPLAPKAATKKPKPAPAKPQEKKRKLVTETSEAPSLAKRSKAGKVVKKRTKKSSFQLVDEFVDECVPENEPRIEVQGKSKEKVSDEQVSLDLLTLQTPNKKGPADQFIFQRRTFTPTESSGHDESSSLYVELGLKDSESESNEEMSGIDAGVQDEGQVGPNPGEQDEGQAGPNSGDAAASQPPSSHVVLARPDLEHMNLKAFDTSIQPNPEKIDEEFTTMAYPNVQENLYLRNLQASLEPCLLYKILTRNSASPISSLRRTIVTAITTTTTSLPPIPPQPQQGSSDSILIQRIGELEQHMADMVEANMTWRKD
ncbi:hypothetical protein Tco_0326765 [Tanacetum coccineum]